MQNINRQSELNSWLQTTFLANYPNYTVIPLTPDASFRRYYRISLPQEDIYGKQHYILMDAPPDKENCTPFVAIANTLRSLNLYTPEILESDLAKGFLILTDFGDQLLLKILSAKNVDHLYQRALNALNKLQQCKQVLGWDIPLFTADFMRKELNWFEEWFIEKYLAIKTPAFNSAYDFIVTRCAEQPYVFMHRDYHSANLMLLHNGQIGILDFQDAFFGPITYDLVSLLRDCYIGWPERLTQSLVKFYKTQLKLNVPDQTFFYWFDMMSMQRHMKALMTFSRKYVRDQETHYLQYIPRTLRYLINTTQKYPETKALYAFFKEVKLP